MYPLTFITSRFIPANSAACARGPLIFIRPEYKDDDGIYHHELTHVRQWVLSLGLHSFLYLLWKPYRLWSEVSAYKVQATYYPDRTAKLVKYARFIANDYNLDIDETTALALLTKG